MGQATNLLQLQKQTDLSVFSLKVTVLNCQTKLFQISFLFLNILFLIFTFAPEMRHLSDTRMRSLT